MVFCNTTLTEQWVKEDPIAGKVTFHHIGLFISAVFGLIATTIALYLIFRHITHYLKPWEQKHIIRILFMIPIYATVSFLSYLYYRHAVYFEILRDCYEAFAISSFFTLMCHYLAHDLHDQKNYFRTVKPRNWVWPMTWIQKCTGGENKGFLRKPMSGLTWFNIVWLGVYQYCFVRVFFTCVAGITQATGRYCESSLHPAFAHIWVMAFEALSVTIAMYCLIQFYLQMKNELAPHGPGLKIACIKLVIFFSFWQSLLISFLVSSGTITPSKKIGYQDIKVGIPNMLLCVEMAIFAVMHIFAFKWQPYDLNKQLTSDLTTPTKYAHGGPRALLNTFNPWDIIKSVGWGFKWLFVGVRKRKQDVSYEVLD
ncbi:DUF300-domain-containing protein [Lophium mytilinum]|uniref:DUF300-domain-containing protein n=1 Tax=Lophium mytilinum TaxID=390894 RepID=A0A6A6R1A1_9PEZI|nr:DUF300-domain-containing protein [Lophium mytilinum]